VTTHVLTREQHLEGAPDEVFGLFAVQLRGRYRLWHHTHTSATPRSSDCSPRVIRTAASLV
jgi:hypothetical protein